MEKESFINEILNSTNGMMKVNPSADLYSKIENRLEKINVVSMKNIWLVAASIVVLLSINIILLATKSESIDNSVSVLEKSIHKNNQLY